MPARCLLCGTSVERGALSRGYSYMVFAPLFPLAEQGLFIIDYKKQFTAEYAEVRRVKTKGS